MTNDLVKRLRADELPGDRQHQIEARIVLHGILSEAADRIEELESRVREAKNVLVKRMRDHSLDGTGKVSVDNILMDAADRIEELERHIELRDLFLVENDLWEKFAKGAEGKK